LSFPKLLLGALLVCVLATTTGLANPGSAHAATSCTKFAAPTGSDSCAGTAASPFLTPQKLVDSLTAGQTGCLRGGTYSLSELRFTRAGSSGAPITLTSAPGERAKLVGGYINVTNPASWVTISDLTIDATDAAQNAVQIMSSNVVFERNDLTNRARPVTFGRLKGCMHLGWNGGSATAVNPIIRLNKFHDCGDPANGNKDHSIYYERVQGGETTDNVFVNTAAFAIHLYPNANGHRVAHNVIDGTGQSGAIFASQNSFVSSNNVFEQNIVTGSRNYAITSYWGGGTGTGNVARNNCWTAGGSGMTGGSGYAISGNVTADPQYVDKAARDYRLKSGSPCLAVVGYDSAAKLAGAGADAAPAPAAAGTNSAAAPVRPAKSGKARRHHKHTHKHTHTHCPKHKHHCHTYTHSHKHSHKHHHKHHHATRHHRR
jgi:hypothetical protein